MYCKVKYGGMPRCMPIFFCFFFLLFIFSIIKVAYDRLSLCVCLSNTNTFLWVCRFFLPQTGILTVFSYIYCKSHREAEGGGGMGSGQRLPSACIWAKREGWVAHIVVKTNYCSSPMNSVNSLKRAPSSFPSLCLFKKVCNMVAQLRFELRATCQQSWHATN
jgi:hypothetical protein